MMIIRLVCKHVVCLRPAACSINRAFKYLHPVLMILTVIMIMMKVNSNKLSSGFNAEMLIAWSTRPMSSESVESKSFLYQKKWIFLGILPLKGKGVDLNPKFPYQKRLGHATLILGDSWTFFPWENGTYVAKDPSGDSENYFTYHFTQTPIPHQKPEFHC